MKKIYKNLNGKSRKVDKIWHGAIFVFRVSVYILNSP